MGTVERALKKLQESRGVRPAQPGRSGSPVPVSASSTLGPEAIVPKRRLAVDRGALQAGGLIGPREHDALIAEQFRGIKRPLIANAFGKQANDLPLGNLMMVTSAVAGEGKTFCSFNLAVSLAQEQDSQVILVDGDVIRPHLTEALRAVGEPGLLDLLADTALEPADVVLGTDTDRLLFLPCGGPRPNSQELLSSERMETMLSRWTANRRHIVLFDSPPLMMANEARVIAGVVGQVVIVVGAMTTPQSEVLEAASLIDEDKSLNLVLNRASSTSDYSYSSTYRYS